MASSLLLRETTLVGVFGMAMNNNKLPTFQTVEFTDRSWSRWAGSVGLHTIAIALLIVVPYTAHEVIQQPPQRMTPLVDPAPYRPKLHLVIHRVPVKPVVYKQVVKPVVPPPVKPQLQFKLPPKQIVVPVKQVTVQEPPAPAPRIEMAKLELPKVDVPEIPRPAPVVKVGGFGNPDGAHVSTASANNSLSAPKLGGFDMPAGNGSARGGGMQKVSMAGFGNGGGAAVGNGSGGNGHGSIRTGGFGAYETAAAVSRTALPAQPAETPVEITFKPKPAYTAEAREKRIEGEVLLEVVFSASGRIEVLRVTRGLGFGLDENARVAASQIRFQPGTRGGAPVDMKGTVHIVFELS